MECTNRKSWGTWDNSCAPQLWPSMLHCWWKHHIFGPKDDWPVFPFEFNDPWIQYCSAVMGGVFQPLFFIRDPLGLKIWHWKLPSLLRCLWKHHMFGPKDDWPVLPCEFKGWSSSSVSLVGCILVWCLVSHERELVWQHRWFSGRMLACHAGGPGSMSGRCSLESFG